MTVAVEIIVALFAVSNTARVIAYVPQIVRLARDSRAAAGVSCLTWLLFAVANLSTVAYAIIVVHDWRMAAIFSVNMVCCLCITGLTVYKRAGEARRSERAEGLRSGKRQVPVDGSYGESGAE